MVIFGIVCTLQSQGTDYTKLKNEVFNGKIKTLSEKAYVCTNNDQDSLVLNVELTYTFSELGLLVGRKGLGQEIFNTYNSDNQISSSSIHLENGVEYVKNVFSYSNGNLVKHINKNIPSKYVNSTYDYFVSFYIYNGENKLVEEKRLSKSRNMQNEVLEEHKKYQYDKNGNCLVEEKFENGEVIKRVEKKYSDHKLRESFTWQEFEGENLYLKDLYEYNEDGTILSHINIIYDYNSTERIADKIMVNYLYKYDYKHRLTEMHELSNKSKMYIFSNFDLNGNWQRKTIKEDGKFMKVIFREFEYYNLLNKNHLLQSSTGI